MLIARNAKIHGLYITLFVVISCSGVDLTIDANFQSANENITAYSVTCTLTRINEFVGLLKAAIREGETTKKNIFLGWLFEGPPFGFSYNKFRCMLSTRFNLLISVCAPACPSACGSCNGMAATGMTACFSNGGKNCKGSTKALQELCKKWRHFRMPNSLCGSMRTASADNVLARWHDASMT